MKVAMPTEVVIEAILKLQNVAVFLGQPLGLSSKLMIASQELLHPNHSSIEYDVLDCSLEMSLRPNRVTICLWHHVHHYSYAVFLHEPLACDTSAHDCSTVAKTFILTIPQWILAFYSRKVGAAPGY